MASDGIPRLYSTPPWSWHDSVLVDAAGAPVLFPRGFGLRQYARHPETLHPTDLARILANVRLLPATPELLEAALLACGFLESLTTSPHVVSAAALARGAFRVDVGDGTLLAVPDVLERLRLAIAAATGQYVSEFVS
ncbi:MAG: hypothetical protein AB7U23_10025 [Dehalococcoidia bacterium]